MRGTRLKSRIIWHRSFTTFLVGCASFWLPAASTAQSTQTSTRPIADANKTQNDQAARDHSLELRFGRRPRQVDGACDGVPRRDQDSSRDDSGPLGQAKRAHSLELEAV